MSAFPSTEGRGLKAFRLSDIYQIDPGILQRAKAVALKREDSFMERVKIGMAAENPSQTVYWIPREAWERVMGQ